MNIFELYKTVDLNKVDFEKISMKFHFRNPLIGKTSSIIFAAKDRIFELNYETEVTTTIW